MTEFEWSDAGIPPLPREGRRREWLNVGVALIFGGIGTFVVFVSVVAAPFLGWMQNINCTNHFDCEDSCVAQCQAPVLAGTIAHPVLQLLLVVTMMGAISGTKHRLAPVAVGFGWLVSALIALALYAWWLTWPT